MYFDVCAIIEKMANHISSGFKLDENYSNDKLGPFAPTRKHFPLPGEYFDGFEIPKTVNILHVWFVVCLSVIHEISTTVLNHREHRSH